MRADFQKNHDHLLTVARAIVMEQGEDASLREIARRANLSLATLYRHFPSQSLIFDAVLRTVFGELVLTASDLEATAPPGNALAAWIVDFGAFMQACPWVAGILATALHDEKATLHAPCHAVRDAADGLLRRAQDCGDAANELDATDVIALVGAVGWLGGQPAFAARSDLVLTFLTNALVTNSGRHLS